MQLTIHRGTREIGGNCVELATANSRILLDIGMPLQDACGADFNENALEGTAVAREGGKYPDEAAVVQGVIGVIQKSANTVIPVYCSGQNIDRIVSLYKAARKTNALLVVDPYTAFMLNVAGDVSSHIPQIEWDNIRAFLADYGEGDIYVNKIRNSERKEIIACLGRKKIKAFDFSGLKQKALLLMRNTMIRVVEKIPQIQGSTLIYSQWEGYLKKDTPGAKKFREFTERNNLSVEYIHTSGHATEEDLLRFSVAVNAGMVVPIHTAEPDKFTERFSNVKLPKDGEVFEV